MTRFGLYRAIAVASLTAVMLTGCDEKKAPAEAPGAAAPSAPAASPTGQAAAQPQPPADPVKAAAEGAKLFIALGCNACHSSDGSMRVGPTLADLYGKQVTLSDGTTATADETYLRTSILEPTRQVTKGFVPTMPSYKGRLTEPEVTALIEWIKTLKS